MQVHVADTHQNSVQNAAVFVEGLPYSRQASVAKEMGWTVQDHAMSLYGLCADCGRKNARA